MLDKSKAIEIITECAKLYERNLKSKNLLILSINNQSKRYNYIEVAFDKSNFMHLTGVIVDKKKISAKYFYNKCLNKKLSPDDFDLRKDGTTELKLSILPKLMIPSSQLKIIGDFNNLGINLYAEKITGNTMACMGFKKVGSYYIPITILKEDTRKLIKFQEQVIAIFSKKKTEDKYNNINYIAKKVIININDLPSEVFDKLDVEAHDFKTNEKIIIALDEIATTTD